MDQLESLARRVDALTAAVGLPPEVRYVGLEKIAAMLDLSVSHIKQRIVCRSDFPKPMRLVSEEDEPKTGHPRWKMSDIVEWADQHRER